MLAKVNGYADGGESGPILGGGTTLDRLTAISAIGQLAENHSAGLVRLVSCGICARMGAQN